MRQRLGDKAQQGLPAVGHLDLLSSLDHFTSGSGDSLIPLGRGDGLHELNLALELIDWLYRAPSADWLGPNFTEVLAAISAKSQPETR